MMDNLFVSNQEIQLAKDRLERADFLFNNCSENMVDYANAELTAAFEYLRYVLNKHR